MVTYNLELEIATLDSQGARDSTQFSIHCNDVFAGYVSGPYPPRNDVGNDYDDDRLWRFWSVPLPTFDPGANNHIALGYTGTGSTTAEGGYVIDFGHVRALRVVGSDGSVYYGEYPLGQPYGPEVYNLSKTWMGLHDAHPGSAVYGSLLGDGDYPPYQWNALTNDFDIFPLGPDGLNSGVAHVYFTIPAADNTLSIQFRADSDSEEADTATINLKWISGGTVSDLGNYTSFPANPDGNSPWKTLDLALGDLYDPSEAQRLEITHVGGEDKAHIRNVWVGVSYEPEGVYEIPGWSSFASDQFEDNFNTELTRSPGYSSKFYSSSGSAHYGVQRANASATGILEAGKTYRVGFYMRDIQNWTNHVAYLEIQGPQDEIHGPVPINNTEWTLVEAEFVCTITGYYDIVIQHYKEPVGGLMETFVDDAYVFEVGADETVYLESLLYKRKDFGQYPQGKPYTADVQDGMVGGVALFNDGGTLPDAAYYAQAEPDNGTQYSMAALEQVIQFPLTWYFGTAFAPPLRQFPRDDRGQGFLRGVRVDNEPSSRQMSLRQGWENTYL